MREDVCACMHAEGIPVTHLPSERIDPEGGRERDEAPAVHGGLLRCSAICLRDDCTHHAGYGNALLLLGKQDPARKAQQQRQEKDCYKRRIVRQPGNQHVLV